METPKDSEEKLVLFEVLQYEVETGVPESHMMFGALRAMRDYKTIWHKTTGE